MNADSSLGPFLAKVAGQFCDNEQNEIGTTRNALPDFAWSDARSGARGLPSEACICDRTASDEWPSSSPGPFDFQSSLAALSAEQTLRLHPSSAQQRTTALSAKKTFMLGAVNVRSEPEADIGDNLVLRLLQAPCEAIFDQLAD